MVDRLLGSESTEQGCANGQYTLSSLAHTFRFITLMRGYVIR